MKQENTRMDIATRKVYPKDELIRFVVSSGKILLREHGGRGYYLHKNGDTFPIAIKRKVFVRLFHREPSEEELQTFREAFRE